MASLAVLINFHKLLFPNLHKVTTFYYNINLWLSLPLSKLSHQQ